MKKTNTEKLFFVLSMVIAMVFALPSISSAMHIMEGYLPATYCIIWFAACLPFVVAGFISIKRTVSKDRKLMLILVMVTAYAFVLSALKIPSVTGSSSHPTGTGLGAILFGPSAMCIVGLIVLVFQAGLLAHGGFTTLGANTFSMAIAGPFMAFAIYKICEKIKAPRAVGVFLAACLGDLFTYCITAVQLALAHPAEIGGFQASLIEFGGIFAVTQVPLAVIEGLIAVVVMTGLESFARPELETLGYYDILKPTV